MLKIELTKKEAQAINRAISVTLAELKEHPENLSETDKEVFKQEYNTLLDAFGQVAKALKKDKG